MTISTFGFIVFFILFAVNVFFPREVLQVLMAVDALVIAVALIAKN